MPPGFSGFYLPLMVVLWLLILRGLSIELRSHEAHPLWRAFWDATLQLASVLMAVVLGAALGNVIRGVPLDASGYFQPAALRGFLALGTRPACSTGTPRRSASSRWPS